MSKLVFVDSTASGTAGFNFGADAAFHGHAAGLVGIWSLDLGDHIAGAGGEELVTASGIVPSKFMITQSTGTADANRPYASGIIHKESVKQVSFIPHLVAEKQVSTWTPVAGTAGTASIKIVIRSVGHIFDYNEFVAPTNDSLNRMNEVIHVEIDVASTDNATTICNNMRTAIAAFESASNTRIPFATSGTSTMICTANDFGTIFETITSQADDATTGWALTNATVIGTGNGHQALSEEQKYLGYKTGFHNRIHLPDTPTPLYADSAKTYDIFQIQYYNGGGSGAGSLPGNDLCTVDIYVPSGWETGSSTVDALFVGAAHGDAAGVANVLYSK